MRILHVYRTYFPDTQGGLEEVIRQITLNTKPLGAQSRVFTLSPNPTHTPIQRPEADVFQVKKHFEIASCSISLTCIARFKEQVEWADVVHYHFPWPFGDFLHLVSSVNKPTLLTYHSDIVRQRLLKVVYRTIMHRFLDQVDTIVCTSPNYFATSETLTKYQEKVEVIPIGLERDVYPQASDDTVINTSALTKPFFLFIGVLRYYKGLHILLDAMQGADYQVAIVGSGPTEKELKQQAKDLNLTNVIFTGHVSDQDKVGLIKSSRGVVFPSYLRSEAFGVTLLEGAMFGRPLISTEVGSGTSHVNVHDKTGLVVAPGSSKALRKAMDYLFNNQSVAEEMGKKAQQRYELLFTGRLMAQRYYELYEALASNRNKKSNHDDHQQIANRR
ncbi:MAG: glycosyltransferase [Gammaproteobacteria bacterium]|nr:glycosyltransferase [Gammaproteobacteria bacterium]